MEKGSLVAPGVKAFMRQALHNCRAMKDRYTNIAFNIVIGLALIVILGTWLHMRYKGKLTPEEERIRKSESHSYIMQKLGSHIATRNKSSDGNVGILTGLPAYDRSLIPN